jgi:iron complex outermembrane receptor protein
VFVGGPPPGGGAGGPPPGGGGFGGPGGGGGFSLRGLGGGGGQGNDGRGRFFVNLFHTIELENKLTIAPNLPVLDLLDGDALSGGGTVRHSVELEGGMFYQGKGMRLSGRYSGPSRVDGSGLPGSTDLRFGSLATLNLRFFVDLGQQEKLVQKFKILKGSRISFDIDNVFDSYRTVTDTTGAVPLRYQRDLIDPVGRSFEIEFRKIF